jgi:hypothetical protein
MLATRYVSTAISWHPSSAIVSSAVKLSRNNMPRISAPTTHAAQVQSFWQPSWSLFWDWCDLQYTIPDRNPIYSKHCHLHFLLPWMMLLMFLNIEVVLCCCLWYIFMLTHPQPVFVFTVILIMVLWAIMCSSHNTHFKAMPIPKLGGCSTQCRSICSQWLIGSTKSWRWCRQFGHTIVRYPHLKSHFWQCMCLLHELLYHSQQGSVASTCHASMLWHEQTDYCTILTLGSQGVTCDTHEHYQVKFTGEKLVWLAQNKFILKVSWGQ